MDIIVWIEYENNYIPFIWLIFGYNRLSKPLILAWLIFGFRFSNIFMTIVVISISATHFLILRIKLSLDFADQFPAYTCCFKIPKNSQLVEFEGYLVDYGLGVQNMYHFGSKNLEFFVRQFHIKIQKMWKKFFFKYECSGHIFWSILTCLSNLECFNSLISSK